MARRPRAKRGKDALALLFYCILCDASVQLSIAANESAEVGERSGGELGGVERQIRRGKRLNQRKPKKKVCVRDASTVFEFFPVFFFSAPLRSHSLDAVQRVSAPSCAVRDFFFTRSFSYRCSWGPDAHLNAPSFLFFFSSLIASYFCTLKGRFGCVVSAVASFFFFFSFAVRLAVVEGKGQRVNAPVPLQMMLALVFDYYYLRCLSNAKCCSSFFVCA